MTGQSCAAPVQVCMTRACVLDSAGAPLAGAHNLYVTDSMIQLRITPELSPANDFEQKNGCGAVCVSYRDCDRVKRYNLQLELCGFDPELLVILVGGHVNTVGGNTRGYAYPAVELATCSNGVGVEFWCKAIINGHQDSPRGYIRFVLPRTRWQFGEKTFANAINNTTLTGFTEENPSFGNGPANDITADTTVSITTQTDTTVPTSVCGDQALIAS